MKNKDLKKQDRLAYLKNIVLSMPEKPGSYQFYDKDGTIIYVGKAKRLKNRVSSYFHKEVDRYKTKVLVSNIADITYTVVNSEEDALLLENSLIKKYKPKYNVLLKDGKTYPSICVTKEYLPRIIKTRKINKQYGTYYGPYPHIGAMYMLLDMINKVFKPRRCNKFFTKEGIERGAYKPCLEYHMHNCMAPCIGRQSHADYLENISSAEEVLKGRTRDIKELLYKKMQQEAGKLEFEQAELTKQQYLVLDEFISKSEVVSHTINNVDVFTITDDDDKKNAYLNYIHVTNGTINQSFTFEYKRKLDETDEELLNSAIPEIREKFGSKAKEIIVPFTLDFNIKDTVFTVPQRGDKKHLLELSEMNGLQYKFDRLKQAEKLNPEQRQVKKMKELQNLLKLPTLPNTIECFDNSNISGTDAVAGLVVFKQMKPSKKDYRKYNIKTVVGPDDYASMQEVVRRRYRRLKEENQPMPDLIITDGGKGQMDVVREVVEDELHLNIPIAGLAKNDKHRTNELLYGFPPQTVGIDVKSDLFKTLTQIQDEVHRYAITFHRDKRSKRALKSELDDIKGIGKKTANELIKQFKNVRNIADKKEEELVKAIGKNRAHIVYTYFHDGKEKNLEENNR